MDERRRLFNSNGGAFENADWSEDACAELWHSTPVKKKDACEVHQAFGINGFDMDTSTSRWGRGAATLPGDSCCPHTVQETELPITDLSGSTIQRQRRELQLLMTELKDREKELNAMAASHRKQHQMWEQDRQRVSALERKGSRLEEELQKRNEVIRVLTRRVWAVESRELEVQKELREAKRKAAELEETQRHVGQKCRDYEERNQSLSSTVTALSTQVGSLQVREEELRSLLELKDKDVTEASGRILELAGRLRDLEAAQRESRSQEAKQLRDGEESKRRFREARHEAALLKEALQQQVAQSSTQREEIIRLKQELQLLRTHLALTGEGDGWKDELLELSRSKQERITSELLCLRQVCESQRNDLQLLRLNQERKAPREETGQGKFSSHDESACHCGDHRPSSERGSSFSGPATDHKDRGATSALVPDGEEHLSRFSLLRLLDEAGLLLAAESSPRAPTGQPPPHTPGPTVGQCGETPPKASPRPGAGAGQPAGHVAGLI